MRSWSKFAVVVVTLALVVVSCGGDDDDDDGSGGGGTDDLDALLVPQDYETIQAAVDAPQKAI